MNVITVPSSGLTVPVRNPPPPLTAFQYLISLMTHRSSSLYFRRVCDSKLYRVAQKWLDTARTGPPILTGIQAGQRGDCGRIPGRGRGLYSSKKVPTVCGAHPASHSVGGRRSTPEDKVATRHHLVLRL